jgi:hypothetical protein
VSGVAEPPPHFDPVAILHALVTGGVEFVLVGGLAAAVRGSPTVTYDVDIAPRLTEDNLEKLAAALHGLGAVRFTHPDAPLEQPHAKGFTERVEQFAAPIGYVDVLRSLRAVGGFDDLVGRAERMQIGDVVVVVAALDDVIRSKEAAGRPKDLAQLPSLLALRAELERGH